jgi:heme-degrading monooxygenase HmoA
VYARVSTLEGPADQIDEGFRYLREQILPNAFQEDEGFKGALALADRQSGKTLTITLWESEETMRATEEEANRLRSELAEAGGETIAAVERYEVGVFEVGS